VRSCHSLALFFEAGEGVPHSAPEALRWAQTGLRHAAAAEGAPDAPNREDVSSCHYMAGKLLASAPAGVAKDERAAMRHFELSLRFSPQNQNTLHGIAVLRAQMRNSD